MTDFVPHSDDDLRAMLDAVGVSSTAELFSEIPDGVRLGRPLDLPAGLSESELFADLERLAAQNTPATSLISFLGAGAYDHYVPAVVDAVIGRSEFATSYTPYQPERSQGMLQAIFEFQTAICELTALPVANASMYDAGTALAEAVMLACAHTGRTGVVVSDGVHPEYRQVLCTETAGCGSPPTPVACGAVTDLESLRAVLQDQSHNFLVLFKLARLGQSSFPLRCAVLDGASLPPLRLIRRRAYPASSATTDSGRPGTGSLKQRSRSCRGPW